MPRSVLTDADVADIRALATEGGLTLEQIATEFGTTKQHVSRLVRGEQRQDLPSVDVDDRSSVASAVTNLLDAAGIDPNYDYLAAAAVALAEKLEAVRRLDSAQSAMAAPGLARALSETLAELQADAGSGGARLGRLRGDEAILVARELGYPDPELIDIDRFDQLEVLRLKRARRLARQRQESGDALIRGGTDV
jgi:transcriptional regulator with XRE-family HTH domain